MMRKLDFDHLIFEPVPKSSHLYIKSNVTGPNNDKKMEYYKNLLQVTVRNFGIIFDLDFKKAEKRFNT